MSNEVTRQEVGDMKLKQLAAGATVAGALCAAAIGIGTGVANADPRQPGGPGGGHGAPPTPGANPPGDHGTPPPGNNFHGPGGPGGGPGGPADYHGPGGPGGPQGHGPGGPGGPGGGPQDHGPGGPGGNDPWRGDAQRGYFHEAPWGDGAAPWGWGAPPRPAWGGPLPGPGGPWVGGPIDYYGYQETPIWNPLFNQFGFDFFGVWIPL